MKSVYEEMEARVTLLFSGPTENALINVPFLNFNDCIVR